jgi:transcriptional regulator with XRE-family HTH domain
MKGIPRPPATYRAKPKTELRRRCRQLRGEGLTYDDIAAVTGVSAGSLSSWLRDMPHEFAGSKQQRLARLQATCANKRLARTALRAETVAVAAASIGVVTDRDLSRSTRPRTSARPRRAGQSCSALTRQRSCRRRSSDMSPRPSVTTQAMTITAVWSSTYLNRQRCIAGSRDGGRA